MSTSTRAHGAQLKSTRAHERTNARKQADERPRFHSADRVDLLCPCTKFQISQISDFANFGFRLGPTESESTMNGMVNNYLMAQGASCIVHREMNVICLIGNCANCGRLRPTAKVLFVNRESLIVNCCMLRPLRRSVEAKKARRVVKRLGWYNSN